MKLHEIHVYNKTYLFVGAIVGSLGAYLSANYKIDNMTSIAMSVIGLIFVLLSFKKPKEIKKEDL